MLSLFTSLLISFTPTVAASSHDLTVRARQLPAVSLAAGLTRVPVLEIELEAGCTDPVGISGLSLGLKGMIDAADITQVTLYRGAERLGTPRAFNRRHRVDFSFKPFLVDRCHEEVISVQLDIAPTAAPAATFRVGVNQVLLYHPKQSYVIEPTTLLSPLRTAAVRNNYGEVEVSYPRMYNQRVSAGGDRIIGRIALKAKNSSQLVHQIRFRNRGTARDTDLGQMYLSNRRGQPFTPLYSRLNGRIIVFDLQPALHIAKNRLHVLEIHATPRKAYRSVSLVVENAADVHATSSRSRSR